MVRECPFSLDQDLSPPARAQESSGGLATKPIVWGVEPHIGIADDFRDLGQQGISVVQSVSVS